MLEEERQPSKEIQVISQETTCKEPFQYTRKEDVHMKEGENMDSLYDLMNLIHFTENVSAKIHGIYDEAEIYKIMKEESGKSKYTITILLLTEDGAKLTIAASAMPLQKLRSAEKVAGLRMSNYAIDLEKSKIFSQVVREEKVLQINAEDIVYELFPRPLALLISKTLGYDKRSSILTPLERHGKIIGILAMSSTELAEYLIPSLKSLAQHVSTALELSDEYFERMRTEKALRESEEKFRGIAERSFDAILESDSEGRIMYASPAIERITGYTPAEVEGTFFVSLMREPAAQNLVKALAKVKRGDNVRGLQIDVMKKDLTAASVEINISPIFTDGKVVGAQEIVRDITERKQAEDMLRMSEEKYKSLVENLNVGVYRVKPEGDGTIIDVNQALVRMFGYDSKEELLKVKISECYINPEDRTEVREKIQNYGFLKNEEIMLKRKDGTPSIVSATGKAVYDKDGALLYFDGVLEDITERKGVEEELEQYRHHLEDVVEKRTMELMQVNEELQREIRERKEMEESLAAEKEQLSVTLRSIGDGVITADTEGRIVLINKAAEQLTGYTQEEAVGKPLHTVFRIVSEKTLAPCENPVERVLKEGAVVGLGNNTILITRNGTPRVIADSGAPIRDRMSKIIGVVLVFRDISEKKKMEQELLRAQKMESISILAGGIAHDFNNILTSILSNASLSRVLTQDTKVQEKLVKIEKATLQAKELTQQLLTFSRGGTPIKKTTSIAELIRDSASFALRGSNVRCHFYFPEGLWYVEVDEGQISQVIHNIIINADQAMPEGGIIRVRAENVVVDKDTLPLEEGTYVKISIADQGVGIPEKYLQKIFDPYFTTKQKGSGLGLSTCYSIIRNHDGYITVESGVGVGTTFFIYLPSSQKKTEKAERTGELLRGEGKILLVDDEELVRDAAREVLQYLGYRVVEAKDGKEAIEVYKKARRKEPFDVVIMDLTIPGGMGGKEAISALKMIDPEVRAIVASGYSTDPIMANYRDHGFKGVVVKPYSMEDLSRILHRVMNEE